MARFPTYARFLLIMAWVVSLTPVMAADGEIAVPVAGTSSSTDLRNRLEQEAFFLINQYRKENRLPLLQWDNAIVKVARAHSRDMAAGKVDFGHEGFGDRVDHLKVVMIGLKGAGENVFETNDPSQVAQSAVKTWLNSPPHRHNIRGDYNYSGLGAWEDEKGMIYFTQIFVKIQPRAQAVQNPSLPMALPLGLVAQPYPRTQP